MTYQAYDINGYIFYAEAKDENNDFQNSGVTMKSYTGDIKLRYYGRIEEISELTTLERRCRCSMLDGLSAS
jgi:hypothetical protein